MTATFSAVPVFFLFFVGFAAVCLTSFLSAVEISFNRLTRALVQDLIEEGRRQAPALLELVEDRDRVNLALRGTRGILQTLGIVSFTVALVGVATVQGWSWWVVMLVALGTIGLIELTLVSLLPTLIVARRYVGFALAGAPLTSALVRASRVFVPTAEKDPRKRRDEEDPGTELRLAVAQDLQELADEIGEPENIEEEDREMLRSVFEFGQTLVREVMVPRTSMITIEAEGTLQQAVSLFIRSGFSRIPVIGEDVDDAVGILYLKDVVRRVYEHPDAMDSPVRHAARPPVFIPEMRLADDEMRAMQADGTHLALVVDEYGGIAGLVTMEDLLEELVGEMKDEHDRFEMEPVELAPGLWRVPARFPLLDLEDLLGTEIGETTVDSVGGLLALGIDQVPLPGASVTVQGLTLTAEEAVGRRRQVGSVTVQLAPANANAGGGSAAE